MAAWLGLLLSPLLAGCVPVSRADEVTPQRPAAPPTIVSLNPCSDAILAEVADPEQVLALSHYSRDPRSSSMDLALARRFGTTRGTVEEVLALHPDLVVAGSFLDPATRSAYGRLGLRLETLSIADSVEGSRAQVRQLAALAGHPERGEALVRRIDAALAAAAPPPGSPPVSAVMWESGGMVPGDSTLIADLMRRAGLTNFSAARGLRQADLLPLERMLADPPRVILTAAAGEGRSDSNEDRLLSHPALAALKGTIRAPFAPGLLYCGGPTIIHAAARLAQVRAAVAGHAR